MRPDDFQKRAAALTSASTFLFVGADNERRLRKALDSRAHVVIADLEDAVHPRRKQEARETLARVLAEPRRGRTLVTVRVSQVGTPEASSDQELIGELPIDGVVVPKATPSLAQLRAPVPLVALVETADGLRRAYETGSLGEVVRLMLGTIDLSVELGLSSLPQSTELLHARSKLVLDSAASGLAAPIDGPRLEVRDQSLLRSETIQAKALGFGAKACVHPAQVSTVERVFAPTLKEIAWARKVDDSYRAAQIEGRAAVLVAGEMVDAPVARRAQAILAEAERGA